MLYLPQQGTESTTQNNIKEMSVNVKGKEEDGIGMRDQGREGGLNKKSSIRSIRGLETQFGLLTSSKIRP